MSNVNEEEDIVRFARLTGIWWLNDTTLKQKFLHQSFSERVEQDSCPVGKNIVYDKPAKPYILIYHCCCCGLKKEPGLAYQMNMVRNTL